MQATEKYAIKTLTIKPDRILEQDQNMSHEDKQNNLTKNGLELENIKI